MGSLTEGELFRAYGVRCVGEEARCRRDGALMAPALVDGYGVLLWWCPECRRVVDDETFRRELASRLSCARKMVSRRS